MCISELYIFSITICRVNPIIFKNGWGIRDTVFLKNKLVIRARIRVRVRYKIRIRVRIGYKIRIRVKIGLVS